MGGVAPLVGACNGLIAVEVAHAHIQRVHLQGTGDVAHHRLNQHHALRAAEATEGGVALGVGFAAVGGDVHILQVVGVVGVEDGAVRHRAGQVGTEAAVDRHLQFQGGQAAGVVKAHAVFIRKGVALAGDHEVVVPVQPQLHGAAVFGRRNGRPHGQMAGLRFLAAEAATHAPAFHLDGVVVDAQSVAHPVLHFAGVLGAAVDQPLVLLLRQHVGNLALQVKVFLPADFQRASQGVRCAFQGRIRITAPHVDRRQHKALGAYGFLHRQDGRQGLDLELHFAGGMAGLHHRFGKHHADHLADELHRVQGKHRLVAGKGGQHRVAGNVLRQHHVHHAGHGARCRAVYAQQLSVRMGRKNGRGIQGASHLGEVVDVVHGASHLGHGAFMELVDAGSRAAGCGYGCGDFGGERWHER